MGHRRPRSPRTGGGRPASSSMPRTEQACQRDGPRRPAQGEALADPAGVDRNRSGQGRISDRTPATVGRFRVVGKPWKWDTSMLSERFEARHHARIEAAAADPLGARRGDQQRHQAGAGREAFARAGDRVQARERALGSPPREGLLALLDVVGHDLPGDGRLRRCEAHGRQAQRRAHRPPGERDRRAPRAHLPEAPVVAWVAGAVTWATAPGAAGSRIDDGRRPATPVTAATCFANAAIAASTWADNAVASA